MSHPLFEEYHKRLTYFKNSYHLELKQRGSYKGLIKQFHFENEDILESIENIFTQYRNSPFTIPKPYDSVILICSGGFDSSSLWGFLLEKYKLNVYPLHFKSSKKQENESFDFFYKFYKKKYKTLAKEPKYFDYPVSFSFRKIKKKLIEKTQGDLDFFLANLIHKKGNIYYLAPMYPAARMGIFAFKALEYALYLNYEKNIKVKTIFIGIVPEDGTLANESTLTVMRSINLNMCLITGDYSWQFTSLAMEAGKGLFLTKKDLAVFCRQYSIPIERSWSCDKMMKFHCGKCLSCFRRKRIFRMAKISDKTVYKESHFSFSLKNIKLNLGIRRVYSYLKNIPFRFFASTAPEKIAIKIHNYQYIRIKNDISYKEDGNRIKLMYGNTAEKNLVDFNGTASFIVKLLLEKPRTFKDLIFKMENEFNVEKYRLKTDLEKFIKEGIGKYIELV